MTTTSQHQHPTNRSPEAMDIDLPPSTFDKTKFIKTSKTRVLTTATLSHPPFSYAHLAVTQLPNDEKQQQPELELDALQVKSYLTSALRQFLGATGAAIPVDILLVKGQDAWVRVPREDLAAFAAAVTAFPGTSSDSGGTLLLQIKACGDWLGALIARASEGDIWTR
mgnify:CR=1 FL=1|jgi:hypothetical protein